MRGPFVMNTDAELNAGFAGFHVKANASDFDDACPAFLAGETRG